MFAQVAMGLMYVLLVQAHSELVHFLSKENSEWWLMCTDGDNSKDSSIAWNYKKWADLYFQLGNMAACSLAYLVRDTTMVFQGCSAVLAFYWILLCGTCLMVELDTPELAGEEK
uniref:Uncharacterized protein n=1 Tax=Octactis speculum TaxID=3111310 RepID=A0A7S2D4V5_9STRA